MKRCHWVETPYEGKTRCKTRTEHVSKPMWFPKQGRWASVPVCEKHRGAADKLAAEHKTKFPR